GGGDGGRQHDDAVQPRQLVGRDGRAGLGESGGFDVRRLGEDGQAGVGEARRGGAPAEGAGPRPSGGGARLLAPFAGGRSRSCCHGQSRTVQSALPVASVRPSAEKARQRTAPMCPSSVAACLRVFTSMKCRTRSTPL